MSEQTREPHLGGMALANGLLVHGPHHWAAAVRRTDGTITVASGERPRFSAGRGTRLPLVRGVLKLAESVAVVPTARLRTPGSRLAMESAKVAVAAAASSALTALVRRSSRSVLVQESVSAVAGILPAVVALRDGDAATWHGVEHKSIAAYESGGASEVANAALHPKEHKRCGTNLVVPLMVSTVLINTTMRRIIPRASSAMRAVGSALAVGTTVELFSFASRNPDHVVSRSVHRIGYAIQARIATKEPGPDAMAVGRAAMDEILRREGVTTE